MYLDYIKADYSNKSEKERKEFVNRDKKHLGKIVQSRITEDIEYIVERWYELEDIGVIGEDGVFLKLLNEAEELYSFGYYVGAISLIGVAAEELCKSIVEKNNIGASDITQFNRINLIYSKKEIDTKAKNALHTIRKIRNNYIHSSKANIYENLNEIKKQCYIVISSFKSVLKSILQVEEIDYSQVAEKLISNQNISFIDFKYRYRNILRQEDIDLQLEVTNKPRVITSVFVICEIDFETELFKEITLLDLINGLSVVVDLTIPQVQELKRLKLEEKNGIIATIISKVSSIGQTEEWMLLEIQEVYRGEIGY
ncbi:DUF4145 domain-containing protein [Metabacillus dongyingensis]|uniref:DUF4145 domain-containing protein n=1 Tax=Metabacillus dongyingensis TaxID=2874282 RepID=UPI001CC162B7|nr:DUF4145 domain-containing protein [Metabacillus dongyingensis]UAL54474.1 DUF4145 domain-containing protein [Metabacillus dongyingensis]